MLRLSCPWCGTRDEIEFSFGGEAHKTRPTLDAGDAEWSDYLVIKENPQGMHYVQWMLQYVCRRWFNVARDTVTHKIHAVYKMGEPKPDLAETDRD